MRTEGLKVVRPIEAIDLLQPVYAARTLLIQSEGTLCSIPEAELESLPPSASPVSLSSLAGAQTLATDLEPPDGWVINQKSCRLMVRRNGVLDVLSIPDGSWRDCLKIPGMSPAIFAAALDPHDSWLLAETASAEPNEIEGRFVTFSACLAEGRVLNEPMLSSTEQMDIAWSDCLGAFVICDSARALVWSWIPTRREHAAIFNPGEEDEVPPTFVLDPQGRWVTVAYRNDETDLTYVVRGLFAGDAVRWTPPAALPVGDYEDFQWHPNREIMACVRNVGDESLLAVFDADGTLLADTGLPDACLGAGVEWSPSGRAVICPGLQAIGVWRVC